MARDIRKLLIFSHTTHYRYEDGLFAYGPYAREIDIWADLFPEVLIAAPCRDETPPGDCLPFTRSNIFLRPQKEFGGETLRAKIEILPVLPKVIWQLTKALREADAIHVRCPGNLGLLGAILGPLFSRRLVAKYCGQWNGYSGEPWTVRLQRAILRSRWWQGPVTVYGQWPHQPPNVIPFFTSILTADQIARARLTTADSRRSGDTLRILHVGRLSPAKNVDVLLSAIAQLRAEEVSVDCSIIGDGPQRAALEAQIKDLGINDCVKLVGGLHFQEVLDFYQRANVLVLASETEGWPKAIAEAMAFGLISIGSNRGLVPEMLGEGRGIVISPRDLDGLVSALRQIARSPEKFDSMRTQAAAWAQRYTLEGLRDSLRDLLTKHWGIAPSEKDQIVASQECVMRL